MHFDRLDISPDNLDTLDIIPAPESKIHLNSVRHLCKLLEKRNKELFKPVRSYSRRKENSERTDRKFNGNTVML